MMKSLVLILALAVPCPVMLSAQAATERLLPLDAQIAPDGSSVTLDWFDTAQRRIGSALVKRRIWGETGGGTWQTIAPDLGAAMQFTDTGTLPGIAYEYQVQRVARDVVDVGYWLTGIDLPLRDMAGIAYLIIDDTVADPLSAHIARFARDLVGDGWQVVQARIPRGDATQPAQDLALAMNLRAWLQQQYAQAPDARHAVILLGHVPVVVSGQANPDGHTPQPLPTDLFYGDMDGIWHVGAGRAALRDNRLPSDAIEMQVGRIDFASLAQGDGELALLRSYLDKNHHWRNGLLGDLRSGYAKTNMLLAETYGLRNIVGPDAVTNGGHHDVGEETPWLWGVDFGDPDGRSYLTEHANKAVFTINFGSHKQKFDLAFNPMTALLAQPFYPLTVGWGARPAWWLQSMALGGTIGEVHLRTVNNGIADEPYRESMDYWPTGQYLWRNPVWVNLLGDPTLRAFMLAPPANLRATPDAEGLRLTWAASPDPDTTGYRVYRQADDGVMTPLTGTLPLPQTGFVDSAPVDGAVYMVRAFGRKTVYAGSFDTLSQGVFASLDDPDVLAPTLEDFGPADLPITLPDAFQASQGGVISAVISPPRIGDLRLRDNLWRYTPPPGFQGTVSLTYARSGPLQTVTGTLVLHIGQDG